MNLEDRLSEHLDSQGDRVPLPADNLERVVRRGRRRLLITRGATAAAVIAVVAVAPVVFNSLQRTTVEFDVANPGAPTPPSSPVSPNPSEVVSELVPGPQATPDPSATDTGSPAAAKDAISLSSLAWAPVLVYGSGPDGKLRLMDGEREEVLDPLPVEKALPDGRGGVVYQLTPNKLIWHGEAIWWQPASGNGQFELGNDLELEASDGRRHETMLRGLLPDGRVLYSVRPAEDFAEDDIETMYAVELTDGTAEPEPLASFPAYESWVVGPAYAADGEPVHARCHLHCFLRRGSIAPTTRGGRPVMDDDEQVYGGLAIEGLTNSRKGEHVAFVEFDPTLVEQGRDPEIVILSGDEFIESARIPIPWPNQQVGTPVLSWLDDGPPGYARLLVTLGSSGTPGSAPTTPFLVTKVFTEDPIVTPVDARGVVLWAEPEV